jgi:formylglycine-generating enzyme required for sulfatase activity
MVTKPVICPLDRARANSTGAWGRTGRCLFVFLLLWVTSLAAGEEAPPPPGTQIVHPGDGAVMVYVPAGAFIFGIDKEEGDRIAKDLGFKDASELVAAEAYPRRRLTLPGFFIDRCEVTVARWHRYVKATGKGLASTWTSRHFGDPAKQDLPAAEIPWQAAKDYAAWAGKALPTEAQWEKAARGTDGRLYPWGNEKPTKEHGHYSLTGKRPKLYVPVGQFPAGASPYGALDMIGNQYEWTSERKALYPGHPLDPADPMTEKVKEWCSDTYVSLRGGSWYHGPISLYAAKRFGLGPEVTYYHVGFRTVWIPPAGYFASPEFEKARRAALEKAAKEDRQPRK